MLIQILALVCLASSAVSQHHGLGHGIGLGSLGAVGGLAGLAGHGHHGHKHLHIPQPYAYGYHVKDKHSDQFKEEKGDGKGGVAGSYGYKDAKGIYRQVNYVADKFGFRAVVKTNEPGTANQNPAHADFHHDHPPYHVIGHHGKGHGHHLGGLAGGHHGLAGLAALGHHGGHLGHHGGHLGHLG